MTIVATHPESPLLPEPLLEVVVLHPRDAQAATLGEADRLLVLVEPEVGGRSPEPAVVSAILRETDLPVRVMLRLDDGLGATGADLVRLAGLARDYLTLGAEGVSFGFLDRDLEIDRDTCAALGSPRSCPRPCASAPGSTPWPAPGSGPGSPGRPCRARAGMRRPS
jgi:copper homeostasis protein